MRIQFKLISSVSKAQMTLELSSDWVQVPKLPGPLAPCVAKLVGNTFTIEAADLAATIDGGPGSTIIGENDRLVVADWPPNFHFTGTLVDKTEYMMRLHTGET